MVARYVRPKPTTAHHKTLFYTAHPPPERGLDRSDEKISQAPNSPHPTAQSHSAALKWF
ncbi:hypothetical protein AA0481_2295 [Acetobacter orientalis NRIC 0481]|uniref:Uncharacterized protein n=1 Tax=Acetobacter orientalis TaxID=146474 RepID=A0A0D6NK85_9PROT|nr:hypothetical protein Abor_022_046 [Acetobacter orientalis]GBR21093.1 hypothetical protein AA0481_2295 [Acetobacter orientalis NRIC 0481]GEL61849.1 hypothetical protein AOR02nite_16910 [Acetobacter orientalis]